MRRGGWLSLPPPSAHVPEAIAMGSGHWHVPGILHTVVGAPSAVSDCYLACCLCRCDPGSGVGPTSICLWLESMAKNYGTDFWHMP